MEVKQKELLKEEAQVPAQPENQNTKTEKENKKRRKKKYFVIIFVFLFLLGVSLLVYGRIAVYYQTHFLPNTRINDIDCSNLEAEPIIAQIDAGIHDYALEVTGRDYQTGASGAVLGKIVPADIDLHFSDTGGAVEELLAQQDELKWILAYVNKTVVSHTLVQGVTFDEEKLKSMVMAWDACKKTNMLKAENAYISEYSEENNSYEIIPETVGTELDVDRVIQLVSDTVTMQKTTLDIEEMGCYKEASVKQDDTKLTDTVNTANSWLGTSITYDWNGTEVVLDYRTLKDWISIEKDEPVLDEERVAEFVKRQAANNDTYGKYRNFMTTLGVEMTLPSGYYGWKTDTASEAEELLGLIYQGSILEKEPIYSSKARKKGISDIGNSYVEIDLTHQHLYLYQDGALVFESDFVSGTMNSTQDCVTPPGVFGLAYKTTNAVLRGETYETPVNYWMPFFGNYGMHDATWRSEFGGDIYLTNGSHGCINLPLESAATIYRYVSAGFPVICYYYEVDPLAVQSEAEVTDVEG